RRGARRRGQSGGGRGEGCAGGSRPGLRRRLGGVGGGRVDAGGVAERKSQVGSGDRSERIRTYNFPQGRVTDHRINLTLYKLEEVMDGQLDELIGPLQQEYQAELLAEEA